MKNKLCTFLDNSPTAFWTVNSIKEELIKNGYKDLANNKFEKGSKYYITRNDSSIIAVNIGNDLSDVSLQCSASHSDSPLFKLKANPFIKTKYGIKLNVEEYGHVQRRPWFDRPLALAGRVTYDDKECIRSKLFKDDKPFCIIASMAPHLDRQLESKEMVLSKDLVPIVSLNDNYDFNEYLASKLNINKDTILNYDLYLYPCNKAVLWGDNDEFLTSNHIDNLECAFTTLMGFIDAQNDKNINLYACFDNEEVGSLTYQGADSNFFELIIDKLVQDLNIDKKNLLDNGMLLSCDNAHGVHPNYQELYDLENAPVLNGGVVIKANANQKYTSDAISSAIFKKLCIDNNIKYQTYANKTGIAGGSTLGNLSNAHVSLISVDLGLAQWSMHSCIETCGGKDIDEMVKAIKLFYSKHLSIKNGEYTLK